MKLQHHFIAIPGIALLTAGLLHADLVLETETAQLGKKGDSLISAALQVERDKDGGSAYFTVNQFEYALSDRSEILIEPFFYEWDKPKDGPSFSGVGDLEITPSYQAILEQPLIPALLFAFKLKVPTATSRDIGTGEFDYQPYIILGKTYGPWIFNANLGYDFVTRPKGQSLNNQVIYDLSVERQITSKLSIFAEIFGNSAPAPGNLSTFAEAIAVEYKFNETYEVFTSVGFDSDNVANIRSGFNIEF